MRLHSPFLSGHWILGGLLSLLLGRAVLGQEPLLDPSTAMTAVTPDCTPDGSLCEFALPTPNASPLSIAAGPNGDIWFTEFRSGRVGRIDLGGEIREFETPSGAGALGEILVQRDGMVWFTEAAYESLRFGFRILVSAIGTITPDDLVGERYVGPLGMPLSIAAGADGNVWFTTFSLIPFGNAIYTINSQGSASEVRASVATGSIAVGPDGALWIVSASGESSGGIGRLAVDGGYTVSPMPLNKPSSLTVGPDGFLWFVNGFPGAIARITLSGTLTVFPTREGVLPQAITSGSDGNLWFTALEDNQAMVGRITPFGAITEFPLPVFGSPIFGGPSYSAIRGITTGPDGNIWFTEPFANKIGRFAVRRDRVRPTLPSRFPGRPRPVDLRR